MHSRKRVVSETDHTLKMPPVDSNYQSSQPCAADTKTASNEDIQVDTDGHLLRGSEIFVDSIAPLPSILPSQLAFVEQLDCQHGVVAKLMDWRGVKVVLKQWQNSNKDDVDDMIIAAKEAKYFSWLLHPCVISCYGVVKDGLHRGLVIEYLKHGSLKTQLKKMKGTEEEGDDLKIGIGLEAARGMEFLHSKRMIHYDLRCDQFYCDLTDHENPVVKVGHIGLSRKRMETFASGNLQGVIPWMAPELYPTVNSATLVAAAAPNRTNEKIDVYSFGVVMWEIWMMGKDPYSDMSPIELLKATNIGNTLLTLPEDCDPQWSKLMEECLHKDPDQRPDFINIVDRMSNLHQQKSIGQN